MLGKVISETQRDWDSHVQPVMAAYQASVHSATGYTPNRLMFGREVCRPLDILLATLESDDSRRIAYGISDQLADGDLNLSSIVLATRN